MSGRRLLLEIGTEEIPARFLPPAIADLKNITSSAFEEGRIDVKEIATYATPRRLVMLANGVSEAQRDVVKEVFGPAKKAAYDDSGKPTKAAEGFASSLGIKTTDLVIRKKGKGEYVVAVIEEKGQPTASVLPDMLKKIVLSLRFPKSMRWGDNKLTFARPVHWITAIFGSETVGFDIEGIRSGNMTRGHRFLSPASFQIKDIESYTSLLENNYVILDQEKRKNSVRDGIVKIATEANGRPVLDEELLDLVNYLVEYPEPVLCGFDADYLKLPKELLVTVMKDHQKYFGIQDSAGGLLNRFIVISNTRAENAETVRKGAERVIKARFDDARFYFDEDRKESLSNRIEKLRLVTFHDELGSVFDKSERVSKMAGFLSERLAPASKDRAVKAALLSKTDLITGVVREFPELQGIMGRYYATNDGEDAELASALEEQYLPKAFGGRLPLTETGALVSLADKTDNVASFFSIGLVPTGSEDPFALRRQAMGAVAILLDRGYNIGLSEIFTEALKPSQQRTDATKTLDTVLAFMSQRVEYIFSSSGYEQDVIQSVLGFVSDHSLKDVTERIAALREFRKMDVFPDFLLAVKRVNNIVPKTPLPAISEDLFSSEEEKRLYASVTELRKKIGPLVKEKKYLEGLVFLSEITKSVNDFFDKVLVMDKDEKVKLNRLSLLSAVWSQAALFADFSKLS